MATYDLCVKPGWAPPSTDRAAAFSRFVGMTAGRLRDRLATHRCRVELVPADIVYITGPTATGKSLLLREFQRLLPPSETVDASALEVPDAPTVVDCFEGQILETVRLLTVVLLSGAFAALSRPSRLSTGQKQQFRLARALAARARFLVADDFCSHLDPISAMTVAGNVHKLAKRTTTTLLLAGTRQDILMELAPDVLILKEGQGETKVVYRTARAPHAPGHGGPRARSAS